MKLNKQYLYPISAVSLAAVLGAAGLAYAHPFKEGGGPGFGDRHHCGGGHGRSGHRGFGMMGKRVDGMLAFVKAELKITPAQEPAWQNFSSTMREAVQARTAWRDSMRASKAAEGEVTLTQRIDRRLAMLEQRSAQLRQMAGAVKTLYAELTPEQQRVADELAPLGRH